MDDFMTFVVDEPAIHLRHSMDGWPMCFPLERDDPFRGTYDNSEVTCEDCLAYLKEK